MKKKSDRHGTGTFPATVVGINRQGLWLDIGPRTYFLTFKENPWFRHVPLSLIFKVKRPSEDHLWWPELDVDLHVDALEHPEKYPLKSRWVQYPVPSRPSPGRVGQRIKRWPQASMIRDSKHADEEALESPRVAALKKPARPRKAS